MSSSDSQRIDGWITAARALRAHPWRWPFGWGPETFRAVYRLHRTQHAATLIGYDSIADHAHNLPLELLVTLGVIGTAAFVYLTWGLWKELGREGRAAMLGLGIMSMVEPIFFPPAAMLCLLLGVENVRFEWNSHPSRARGGALVLTILCFGVWVNDFADGRRSLALHPHESEANQLAVIAALANGNKKLALIYARCAAKADPVNPHITEQTAKLEAYLR